MLSSSLIGASRDAGRSDAALESLKRAIPLAPVYYDLMRDYARALELAGHGEEALEVYRRIETGWPGRRAGTRGWRKAP